MRELADACGLTPGAIYNHYASKEALLFAIVDRVHDEADTVLSETLRAASPDPAAQLEALAAAFTAFHIARPRETRVANRDYIYLPGGERESIVRRRRRVRALFADVLRAGERDGSFSFGELGSEDAVQAASMAILNMVVLVAEWFDPAGPRSAQDTAALHGRLALRIARAQASAAAQQRRIVGGPQRAHGGAQPGRLRRAAHLAHQLLHVEVLQTDAGVAQPRVDSGQRSRRQRSSAAMRACIVAGSGRRARPDQYAASQCAATSAASGEAIAELKPTKASVGRSGGRTLRYSRSRPSASKMRAATSSRRKGRSRR